MSSFNIKELPYDVFDEIQQHCNIYTLTNLNLTCTNFHKYDFLKEKFFLQSKETKNKQNIAVTNTNIPLLPNTKKVIIFSSVIDNNFFVNAVNTIVHLELLLWNDIIPLLTNLKSLVIKEVYGGFTIPNQITNFVCPYFWSKNAISFPKNLETVNITFFGQWLQNIIIPDNIIYLKLSAFNGTITQFGKKIKHLELIEGSINVICEFPDTLTTLIVEPKINLEPRLRNISHLKNLKKLGLGYVNFENNFKLPDQIKTLYFYSNSLRLYDCFINYTGLESLIMLNCFNVTRDIPNVKIFAGNLEKIKCFNPNIELYDVREFPLILECDSKIYTDYHKPLYKLKKDCTLEQYTIYLKMERTYNLQLYSYKADMYNDVLESTFKKNYAILRYDKDDASFEQLEPVKEIELPPEEAVAKVFLEFENGFLAKILNIDDETKIFSYEIIANTINPTNKIKNIFVYHKKKVQNEILSLLLSKKYIELDTGFYYSPGAKITIQLKCSTSAEFLFCSGFRYINNILTFDIHLMDLGCVIYNGINFNLRETYSCKKYITTRYSSENRYFKKYSNKFSKTHIIDSLCSLNQSI